MNGKLTAKPSIGYLLKSPYFILNFLCILIYPACRYFGMESRAYGYYAQSVSPLSCPSSKPNSLQFFGHDREAQVLSLLLVYVLVKLYQTPTWEFFFAYLFQYSKVAFITLFFLQQKVRLGVYYALLCFVLWLALAHPRYDGVSKLVRLRNVDHLEEVVGLDAQDIIRNAKSLKTETKKQRKNFAQVQTTILVFTANWADNSYFTYPLWVWFANRFTT